MEYATSVLTNASLAHANMIKLQVECAMGLSPLAPTITTATLPVLRPTVTATFLPVPLVGLMLMYSKDPAAVTVDTQAHQMHAS